MNENIDKKYKQYAQDVIDGKIIACKYIKQACQRYLDWFNIYEFKPKKADKVVKFIYNLKHFTGKHNGKHFELLPYQQWMIYNIFGFYYPNTNERVVHYVYWEISRKNGKTALASAIMLYMLLGDGESGSEVEFVANSRQQAHIAFDMCNNFSGSIDPSHKYIKTYRDKIKFDVNKSFMQVLSSDASGNDGYNSYAFVLDEAHAQPNADLWNVMISSQGMRVNNLGVICTTAGFLLNGFCHKYRESCIEILAGAKQNDSQFVAIFTIDDDDDWTDENCWVKANPSLDVTVSKKYIKEQINNAIQNTSLETGVRTKNLNQWVQSMETWIANDIILQNTQDFDLTLFNNNTKCYIGVDLASVSDLTAVNYMFEHNDKFYFKTQYYLPETALSDSPNRELYKEWQRYGFLTITPGNVTDYDYIINDLVKMRKMVKIMKVCYDAYNSTQWAVNCTELQFPLKPFSQSIGHFNQSTKEFERLLKSTDKIVLENNPITRWCFANVVIKTDWNDNSKPIKGGSDTQKIDGVIAILESLGGYLETPKRDFSII